MTQSRTGLTPAGKIIAERMHEQGRTSVADLARHVGLTDEAMGMILRRPGYRVDDDTIEKLAAALGLDPFVLLVELSRSAETHPQAMELDYILKHLPGGDLVEGEQLVETFLAVLRTKVQRPSNADTPVTEGHDPADNR